MTRYFILTASFILLFVIGIIDAKASDKPATEIFSNNGKESDNAGKTATYGHSKSSPASHGAKSQVPAEKHHAQAPTMDETPHIHRFHKERVKKIKQHHTKCWIASQVIVVLCNLSLLVIAYMHIIH